MVRTVEDAEEFDKVIAENDRVVVDFFAEWCGPCKRISPHLHDLEKKSNPSVVVVKVDVDDDDLASIVARYKVRAMPTFKVFWKGTVVKEITGANKAALDAAFSDLQGRT